MKFGINKYAVDSIVSNEISILLSILSADVTVQNIALTLVLINEGLQIHKSAVSVVPKHTLFKVLYFILAKFKNYNLFINFFSQIL